MTDQASAPPSRSAAYDLAMRSAHLEPAPARYVVVDGSKHRNATASVALSNEGHIAFALDRSRGIELAEGYALILGLGLAVEMAQADPGHAVWVYTDQIALVNAWNKSNERLYRKLHQHSYQLTGEDRARALGLLDGIWKALDLSRVKLDWMRAHPKLRPVGPEYGHRDLMDRADALASQYARAVAPGTGPLRVDPRADAVLLAAHQASVRPAPIDRPGYPAPVPRGAALNAALRQVIVPGVRSTPEQHTGPQALLVIDPVDHRLAVLSPGTVPQVMLQRHRARSGLTPESSEEVTLSVRHALHLLLQDLGSGGPPPAQYRPTATLTVVDRRINKVGAQQHIDRLAAELRPTEAMAAMITRAREHQLVLRVYVPRNKDSHRTEAGSATERMLRLLGLRP